MFKTTAIDTLKQDKKCQACWYIILSTMSGSTTVSDTLGSGSAATANTNDGELGKVASDASVVPATILEQSLTTRGQKRYP